MEDNLYIEYLKALKTPFVKLARLEFLNPDGTTAYAVDNSVNNSRSSAFIQEGSLTVNLQNGARRTATVKLANTDDEYAFAVNKLWYGQEIRLGMGLILPDGSDYYISQGVFLITDPEESLTPNSKDVTLNLVDKWALFDGNLSGNTEGPYQVNAGTNIFQAMASILLLDKYSLANNSTTPIDGVAPLFTNYYNDKTQILADGTIVSLIDAPYNFTSGDDGNLAEVLLGLAEMLAAWIGYNSAGRLVIDPSQDDIDDNTKPVLWSFRNGEMQFLGDTYTVKVKDVYNDVIVCGEALDDYSIPYGRAQNQDPTSGTCISRIGLKTKKIVKSNYYSSDICRSYAEWQLKRMAALSKSVTIRTTQMFHLQENTIVEIERPDKDGSPIERHVIQGYTLPIAQNGEMIINAISVKDYPQATIIN